MTAIGSPERPRSRVLLGAAGALAIVVVVLVLLFGIARPPELEHLAAHPDPAPSASIAWLDRDGGDSCLQLVSPEGARSEVVCADDLGEPIAWDDDGIVVLAWGLQEETRTIDPDSGADVSREPIDESTRPAVHQDTEVVTRTSDGALTVTVRETEQVVWETQVHENYHVRTGVRSPDGAWVALIDSADRLLVVPADGSEQPRVWAEGITTWDRPVWEGSELPAAGA